MFRRIRCEQFCSKSTNQMPRPSSVEPMRSMEAGWFLSCARTGEVSGFRCGRGRRRLRPQASSHYHRSRLGPAGHFKASIVTFAFAQVRADDGTKCGLPSAVPRVGINGVGAAVRIFDFKLGEYADTVTIVIRIATVEAEPTSIPAVTEPETMAFVPAERFSVTS